MIKVSTIGISTIILLFSVIAINSSNEILTILKISMTTMLYFLWGIVFYSSKKC